VEHLSTFGLSRDPFANEPQLEGWFASPAHLEAERRLARGVRQGKGLVLLQGAGGTGKTLLVRRLLESLEEEMFEACMLVPLPEVSDVGWLLDRLARQLGVEEPPGDPAGLLAQIYDQLAQVREDGRHAVLLVDEAQVLARAGVLPALRGLLNLEYEDRRLLSVVLAGMPELGRAVAAEPALADRVELAVALEPMDAQSSADYLRHRIRSAGGNPAILESAAVDALVKLGEGVPRRLNTLADAALFEAHMGNRPGATAEDVARGAKELGLFETPAEPAADAASAEIGPGTAPTAVRGASPPVDRRRPRPQTEGPMADATRPLVHTTATESDELAGLLGDEGDEAVDLEEVVATSTPSRRVPPQADAGRTMAMLDEAPAAPRARSGRAEAQQTVAIFGDGDADGADTDGELDDLFADLVEE
jgi:type II secretory pathway predicted ATPase ExeA